LTRRLTCASIAAIVVDAWSQLRSPSNRSERFRGQVAVAGSQSDPGQVNLVGNVDREPRKQRASILPPRRHRPGQAEAGSPYVVGFLAVLEGFDDAGCRPAGGVG
jgi:hypothetical protein